MVAEIEGAERRIPVNNLIVVTGPPGSGKTTVAVPLAERLGFPLITKDAIKEALDASVSHVARDLEWSRLLGRISFDAMFAMAAHFPDVVMEANFWPDGDHRNRLLQLHPEPIEIFCRCPLDEARRRYRQRAPHRHRIHVETDLSLERLRKWEAPLGLGVLIEVDTAQAVDGDALAGRIR